MEEVTLMALFPQNNCFLLKRQQSEHGKERSERGRNRTRREEEKENDDGDEEEDEGTRGVSDVATNSWHHQKCEVCPVGACSWVAQIAASPRSFFLLLQGSCCGYSMDASN